MTFNDKTNTIIIGKNKETDSITGSGALLIKVLRDLAERKNSPLSILNDWKIIEKWLGCTGRQLSKIDYEIIEKAWRAYILAGVAPTEELQSAFKSFSDGFNRDGIEEADCVSDIPPSDVKGVFDRLLATEADINKKRTGKFNNVHSKLEAGDPLVTSLSAVKTIKELNKKLGEKIWYRLLKVLWGVAYVILSILVVVMASEKRYLDAFEVLIYFTGFAISYLGATVFLKRAVYYAADYVITGKVFLKEKWYSLLLIVLCGILSITIILGIFDGLF